MDSQQLLIYGFLYFAALIAFAWLAEKTGRWPRSLQAIIYGLSLGVYCSSWTFLGAVGNATEGGWSYVPIYLGPVLLFLIGWPFVRRLMVIGARNKVTSIADFIGSRYGKDQRLAALVTLVAVIGTLPYIALQLRAIALAWSAANLSDWNQTFNIDTNASLLAAIFLGWFAIVFGTRIIDGQQRHRGLLTAVAAESIVKLIAFIGLALFATVVLLSLPDGNKNPAPSPFTADAFQGPNFYTQLLLAAAAIICLPRQFHVMVVEYHDRLSTRLARWLFPLYLILFAICVVPIVEAGQMVLGHTAIPPDTYVLSLPAVQSQGWLIPLGFLGALSAATSMVLVATIALSIMISNELLIPVYLSFREKQRIKYQDLAGTLRYVRRGAIILILFLSWLLEQSTSQTGGLASMGLLAFASSTQLLPAIVAGLYWNQAHRHGVIAGIVTGCLLWAYCLLTPALLPDQHSLLMQGPLQLEWLKPQNLFGTGAWVDYLTHGVLWSLGLNIVIMVLVSWRARFTELDYRQANAFRKLRRRFSYAREDYEPTNISVHQLQSLIDPLLGSGSSLVFWRQLEQKLQHRLLPYTPAPRFVVYEVESKLASFIGAVSAHRATDMLRKQKLLQVEDLATLMGPTSRQLQFSQSLLQTTLENIPQGISVVDENLKLVAWNGKYERIFNYPPELLFVGCPIERIYRHNAEKGLLSDTGTDISAAVNKRLQMLRSGNPYRMERRLPNGIVIEIQGTPIPSGGYVTAFTDVTAYQHMVDELEQAKQSLEARVAERTQALSQANESLQQENSIRARIEKELKEVHDSKSRFLAAASHDLMQPINAARLLVATLNRQPGLEQSREIEYVDSALASAEAVVSSLREIARLDSGKMQVNREAIDVHTLLSHLVEEFVPFASRNQLELRYVPSHSWVDSDPHLLRRILQNFLSNAIRYTRRGKILVGCRHKAGQLVLEVWDTGPGIAEEDQQRIFNEFERLQVNANEDTKGLGLGLSIASRMAQLLGHRIDLQSWPGKGSVFRLTVPLTEQQVTAPQKALTTDPALQGLRVLCIDNEPHLLAGLQALLNQWGCQVTTAGSLGEVFQHWHQQTPPDLVIADYHLDNNETGLDALNALKISWNMELTALIISADTTEDMLDNLRTQGYPFLAKPVQPAGLRLTLRKLLRQRNAT